MPGKYFPQPTASKNLGLENKNKYKSTVVVGMLSDQELILAC
jgi:hypothetical protein